MEYSKKVKIFVEEFIESIVSARHIESQYSDLIKLRDSLIEGFKLDINNISTEEIVNHIKNTDYLELFDNIKIEDAANVIFLRRVSNEELRAEFDKMTDNITEKNYLNKIYSYNEMYEDRYGIDLNNIEIFFKDCKYHQKLEIMSNMATFIEAYYQTNEGKEFIESYKNKKLDPKASKEQFEKLFEKMNESSIRTLFYKNDKDEYTYTAAGAGTLDGLFIIFDKDNNLTFNVSTTASPNVRIEGTSVLRHAITSKIISEAIIEEIDKALINNKEYNNKYGDDKEDLKTLRAEYWNNIKINNKLKNSFIGKALLRKTENISYVYLSDYEKDDYELQSGAVTEKLTKSLNRLQPDQIINERLNTSGIINEKKMREFFSNKNNNEFKTNFVSEVKDIRNKKAYENSNFNEVLKNSRLNIYELKTFLQNAVLKEMALQDFRETMDKKSIDLFHDKIITRRVFSPANQIKINQNSFSNTVDRFIINNLLINNNKEIDENVKFLTEIDFNNIRSYFNYIINPNIKVTNEEYINQNSYVSHVNEKLDSLNIETDINLFLDKVSSYYDVDKASDMLALSKKSDELEMYREMLLKLGVNPDELNKTTENKASNKINKPKI